MGFEGSTGFTENLAPAPLSSRTIDWSMCTTPRCHDEIVSPRLKRPQPCWLFGIGVSGSPFASTPPFFDRSTAPLTKAPFTSAGEGVDLKWLRYHSVNTA